MGSSYSGGGVYNAATVTNCTFIENAAYASGGAVGAVKEVINCTFSKNYTIDSGYGGNGGAIANSETVTNCRFTENNSGGKGGAIVNVTTIKNCIFRENYSRSNSGGAVSGCETIEDCTFIRNTAKYGGGIYYDQQTRYGSGNVINCTFIENSADIGGGVHHVGTITNCTFTKNTAKDGGGVAETEEVKNCIFTDNIATRNGGGIFDVMEARNCTFINNTAGNNGGGISRIYTSIIGCTFKGNIASADGGSFYADSDHTIDNDGMLVANSTFTNNSASKGGAICNGAKLLNVKNCTLIDNISDNGAEFYTDSNMENKIINTILWNSGRSYIVNENTGDKVLTLTNCAFVERSVFGNGTIIEENPIYITEFSTSHPSEIVSVDNVGHTVFKLKATDTALIHGGVSTDVSIDQIGTLRNMNSPSIGAIEYSTAQTGGNGGNSGNGGNTPTPNPTSGDSNPTPNPNPSPNPNTPTVTIPTITTSYLNYGYVGYNYEVTLQASGENITWSIISGALPEGLELNETSGTISGIPYYEGYYTFTVQAENSSGKDTQELSITIYEDYVNNNDNENENVNSRSSGGGSGGGCNSGIMISGIALILGLLLKRR